MLCCGIDLLRSRSTVMTQINPNKWLAIVALTALIAAPIPAVAASKHHHRSYSAGHVRLAYRASPPIYSQGRYLGNDPDPSVRFEIRRDPYFARR
jgi:hypothetical protein